MILILKGKPISTNSIYRYTCRGKFPAMYMTKDGKELKESYQWQLKNQFKNKPFKNDVGLQVDLFFNNNRKNDIDNFQKILQDSMNGIIFDDDSQIQELTIRKNIDKKFSRIEVEIYEL